MEDGLLYCLSLSLEFTIITRPPVLFALFRYDAPIGPLAGSFHTSAQTMVPQSGVRVLERPRPQHLIPTRVKADSFWGFQSGASQIPWRRTGGSPCGQGLRFARIMTQPSFGP